jgi:UDP-N-acetylglucosamine 4,6-dehydratase
VIRPTIRFFHSEMDYAANRIGETGRPVPQGFEYNSGNNAHFLTVPEIREVNRLAGA